MGVLRFLFALAVVITHSSAIFGYELIPGALAVQSFYMISGFYMALVLNEKYIGEKASYKLFISNRLLRLYPTYWAVFACVSVYSIAYMLFSRSGSWGEYLGMYGAYWDKMNIFTVIFLFFTNIFIFFQDIVMFLGLNAETGSMFFTPDFNETSPFLYFFLFIPQAWTVGLELMFYLCAPFLVRRKLPVIIILICLSLGLRVFLIHNGYSNDPWTYRFFPNELALFLSGALAYKVYAKIKLKTPNKALAYSLFFVIIIFTFSYPFVNLSNKYILFLVILFIGLPYIFNLTKKSTYDHSIGELSYPIYICHWFIISLVKTSGITINGDKAIIVCAVSILFSLLLNRLIEIPLNKYRQRRISKKI